MGYFIDILESTDDQNESVDKFVRGIAPLYQKSWAQIKSKYYPGRAFDLNIVAIADMWYKGQLKVFVAMDTDTKELIGFLAGVVYRPLYFDARLFHVQDWYANNDPQMERDLFDYMVKSIRILGCNELWIQEEADLLSVDMTAWELKGQYVMKRFTRKG